MMRAVTALALILLLAGAAPLGAGSGAGTASPQVLVFSKTAGFRHGSISDGIAALEQLGTTYRFSVTATEDAGTFTDAGLADYDAVVFLLTSGDILNADQQAAFERYIQAGGGFVGIHSASDTEYQWPWYGQLIGAYFDRHPAQQTATLTVENANHASTRELPTTWSRFDEWYDFRTNPRGDVNVLLTIDEATYSGGGMGADHPLAWYQEFDGGRSWYTALGHTRDSYREPEFLEHILGGIEYATGMEGKLTVDSSGQWFVRENSGAPVFMAGAGGPEGFLYESDTRKQEIVDALITNGANALYLHSIRSFEGDGYSFEDPFATNEDTSSGIAPGIFENWLSYLTQLDEAGVVSWFHVIDDTARPWGCDVPLSQDAVDYIETLVNTFKHLNHLVWLSGEEYLMGSCSAGEDADLMSAIAAEIRRHDPIHPIGVHHNNGQSMQFGTDPNVNVFGQQICGNQAQRSPTGVHNAAERGSWVYVMAECHPWHLQLLGNLHRETLRLSNWGSAMAGGYVLMYNAYECQERGQLCSVAANGSLISPPYNDPHDPTPEMLADLRRLREFMEATRFTTLTPRDDLAQADTRWVLANTSSQEYILYDFASPRGLGVGGLAAGDYTLTWFDPRSGASQSETASAASAPFSPPSGFGPEVALHLAPAGAIGNRPPTAAADSYATPADQTLSVAAPGVLLNDTDLDDDALTAVLVDDVSQGTLNLSANGSFSYSPTAGFEGTDTFTYQANDSAALSSPATVTIRVGNPGITLELVDAASDTDQGPLTDGQQLALASLGFTSFSVRTSEVPDGTASVRFALTGPVTQTQVESAAPFALFGDSSGDFNGEPLSLGTYNLTVEAFSATGGGGDLLATLTIQFAVVALADAVFSDGFE